jgi:hypothetical protein
MEGVSFYGYQLPPWYNYQTSELIFTLLAVQPQSFSCIDFNDGSVAYRTFVSRGQAVAQYTAANQYTLHIFCGIPQNFVRCGNIINHTPHKEEGLWITASIRGNSLMRQCIMWTTDVPSVSTLPSAKINYFLEAT